MFPNPLGRLRKGGEQEPSSTAPYVWAGAFLIVFVLGAMMVWSAVTRISGAVISGGTVVVESSVKKVQHLSGGIVGEIRVREGDSVNGGDLLIRLDETVTRANLQIILKQLDELAGRAARVKAERDGKDTFEAPALFLGREEEPEIRDILEGEHSLLKTRVATTKGQRTQLNKQIRQLEDEIVGITAQTKAKAREIELIGKELADLEELEKKNLVPMSKMMALRREAARLEGEHGQMLASAARARGKISEIEIQILQIEHQLKTELVQELREIQAKEAELQERRVAALDELKRVEIRAPQSGIVHELAVHTIGGVINPAEPIMLIVPRGDGLVVEVHIHPENIDQVHAGAQALVRFTAFNARTTPEIKGTVKRVSPDLSQDPHTGVPYYGVRIQIPPDQTGRLGDAKLVPGMPAEVHIKTQDRTALAYLVKPLEDQIARAFRER